MMLVAKNIQLLEESIHSWKQEGLTIGFVPTMGALHKGHLSLLERAQLECDKVVCSIFVNPTQFNNASDLDNYPVQTKTDLAALENANCDLVFLPNKEAMYPEGEATCAYNLEGLDLVMEGAHRPGHFDGVCTIVHKLFEIVLPNKAYFGEKDYQQLAIIRQLTSNLSFNIEIIGCPIVREEDGLAMSSRNTLLSVKERALAPHIYKTIQAATALYKQNSVAQTKSWIEHEISKVSEMKIDYVEIAHAENLQAITDENQPAILCVAVFLGSVRLIDNILLNK